MPIELRLYNVGDIEYFYIPKGKTVTSFQLFPPDEFENNVFRIIRTMPKNVIQLNDPFVFFGNAKQSGVYTPLRFNVVYPENLKDIIAKHPNKISIKVFLFDSTVTDLDDLVEVISKTYSVYYFTFVDKQYHPSEHFKDFFFKDDQDLIKKLIKRKSDIEAILLKSFPKQQVPFKVDLPFTDHHAYYNKAEYFIASHTNYWTLNQMIGNDWSNPSEDDREEMISSSKVATTKDKDNLDRYDIIIGQIHKIQDLEMMVVKDRKVKFPRGDHDWLSPLIVVIPFNYPSLNKFLGVPREQQDNSYKKIIKALSQEQAINYLVYSTTDNVTPEDIRIYGHVMQRKNAFLDEAAFLHASFTFSPVFRFPVLGDSIKRELGFFKPETINETKFRNSKTLINLFGRKLADRILPDAVASRILNVPNQIVAITDLPIEWLSFHGLNLCTTHDITRIPEMPFGGILSSYNTHSNLSLTIKPDILKRVLVILGVSTRDGEDQDFKEYFQQIEELSYELGFVAVRCSSKDEIIKHVQTNTPDVLIFDCHGGFDQDKLSSFLWVGDEKITGKDIVENQISAPIVFLSACHTNPNYGYVNKIADAFFEAGCMSITATYFPISIRGGTTIYFRLLNLLKIASVDAVHKNWLEFVCHVIRTSYLRETIFHCKTALLNSRIDKNEKTIITSQLDQLNLDTSLLMLRQTEREQAFKSFEINLKKILPKRLVNLNKVVAEHCFYTNVGRGDLILFESWINKFDSLNKKEAPLI